MEYLDQEAIHAFCTGGAAEREQRWVQAQSEVSASLALPCFEVCHAVYRMGVSARGLDGSTFRACWGAAVARHGDALSVAQRNVVRCLSEADDAPGNIARDVWQSSRVEVREVASVEGEGAAPRRARIREPPAAMECLRRLNQRAVSRVGSGDGDLTCWDPMAELPSTEPALREPRNDLLLDTNFFVELLEDIGRWGADTRPLCGSDRHRRVLASVRQTLLAAIQTRGVSGKLIVPTAVLVEAYGVVRCGTGASYAYAAKVMDEMEQQGDGWALWNAFAFPPIALEVVDALVCLADALAQRRTGAGQWPDFLDALVLAHGLREGCPVISGEWVDKDEWDPVAACFPWLKP